MKHHSPVLAVPEPEVMETTLDRSRRKALTTIIADLLNDHEPLLKAVADGTEIVVSEKGGKPFAKVVVVNVVR